MKKLTKIIVALSIGTGVYANQAQPQQPNVPQENIQTVKPVSVQGIRYNKGLVKYSLFDTTKDGFKEYTQMEKINGYMLKNLYNRIDNPTSIALSAYGYDYGYERPDLAENFYALFPKTAKMKFEDKLRYVDFLLRTGRVNEIKDNLSKSDCMGNFKYSGKCYYYLGVSTFLATGDHKNIYINLARHTEDKAKEIFFDKDVK